MKKYLSILIFLFCSTAYAQFGRPTATSREITLVSPLDSLAITKYIWLGIPLDTPHINMSAIRGFLSSQNYLRPIDTNFIHNLASQKMDSTRANLLLAGKQPAGTYLVPGDTSFLHSKIIDTTSLSNRINGKQNVGSYQTALNGTGLVRMSGTSVSYDTTSYQSLISNLSDTSKYAKNTDTLTYIETQTAAKLKVAYSDTGSKVPSYYKTLGQLSSTYLPYFNGTSLLNTGIMYNGGKVGIGLTNPAYALDMAAGDAYGYNGTVMAQASTTLFNYFLGGAGTIGAAATGTKNTGTGYQALSHLTTGNYNTANGYESLYNDTTGDYNTANGYESLYSNTTGNYNTANGYKSLYNNTTGSNNTANGLQSLYNNTTGNYTPNGTYSLYNNTTGAQNTANGYNSLYNNTTGNYNTANGYDSLYSNTTGSYNTANGMYSLYNNTTGNYNTANGYDSLYNNTTNIATLGAITGGSGYTPGTYTGVQMTLSSGSSATTYPIATIIASSTGAITSVVITTNGLGFKDTTTFLTASTSSLGGTGSGFSVAVASLSTGQYNTAYGYQAGRFISGGVGLNETSTYSTYIGYNAYPLASGDINETVIGNGAVGSGSNTVTLGGTGTTGTIIPYGNVGIGSTTTDSTLRVAGSGNFTTNLKVGGRFNLAGAVATVNLDTTEAGGVPAISDTVEYTGLTAAVSQRNFNYTNHAGFYEVDGCLVVTTGVPTGAITVNIVYTDALGATTQTPILAFVATGTGRTYFHIPVRTVSGWVAWSTTLVAAPTYNISLACKRIY